MIQSQLCADLHQGLADAVVASDGQVNGSQLGKNVILPLSFTGGPRYQHQLYQDAMGIVCRFGKPDFFVTFTCNPRWQEITCFVTWTNCGKLTRYCCKSLQVEVEIPST